MVMNHLGVQTAILSVSAPGPLILSDPVQQAALARSLNEYAAQLRDEDHSTFGFFASLPDLTNTTAALAEISHAFDVLSADGVTLFTRYGADATYLDSPALEPIWDELDRREATVFVHPTHPVDTDPVNPQLPQPILDYPHETTRTAVDMITAGTLKRHPNVKVILSHAGGTLPLLATRFSRLRPAPMVPRWVPLPGNVGEVSGEDEAREAIGRFYYDVALSTDEEMLRVLKSVVPEDHILFGSDFPYPPSSAYPAYLNDLETADLSAEARDKLNFQNAQTLFSRLGKHVAQLEE